MTKPSSNTIGILFMLGGFFTYSIVDTGAKVLTSHFHPMQIVWIRQLGFLAFVLFILARTGPKVLRTSRPGLQIIRGLLAVASATAFIFALQYIELAEAVAISFVAPFFVTILGALWLGEKVGLRRWTAVALGFIGSLIIIRPGMGIMHPAAFLVVFAAMAFAFRQAVSRVLGAIDSTQTTIAYSGLVGAIVLTIPLPFFFTAPDTLTQIAVIAMVAILAALAEFFVIRALELAEAVAVAPVHYSLMIWGTFWGYVVFGHWPDLWTWTGAAVIIASGIYTIYRERQVART